MGGGVDSIHLFLELFSQPKLDNYRDILGYGHVRGHPSKLGNLAIFYFQKNYFFYCFQKEFG